MMGTVQIWIAVIVAVIYIHLRNLDGNVELEDASFNVKDRTFTINNPYGNELLKGDIGVHFNLDASFSSCEPGIATNATCALWPGVAKLELAHYVDGGLSCYTVQWQPLSKDAVPQDCINVGHSHWYGGAETLHQRWPIEHVEINMQQYLSTDLLAYVGSYGSVLERYWLSSSGVAVHVHDDVPLHVSQNHQRICFKADYANSWYPATDDPQPRLAYTVCSAPDIKTAHVEMSKRLWQRPQGAPDHSLIVNPIWSTWARYKTTVSQEKVVNFGNEILDNGFKACQIEIDDIYTINYGDQIFDPIKFPDPSVMTKTVHDMGFNVTSWVTPFANIDSTAFRRGTENGYFIHDGKGKVPGLVQWWQGVGAIVDFTNDDAVSWYFGNLRLLRDSGIDSFKFDAGEVLFLPAYFTSNKTLPNPGHYTRYYATAAAQHAGRRMEVRAAYQSQHLPVFVRMMDKESRWGYDIGLRSLIPTALQFGLEGYPYILPDMIGGNAHDDGPNDHEAVALPDKELYIRWLQVTLFMPALQFSITPWQYDQETVDISLELMQLREHYIVPKMLPLAEESAATGYPIIRPLWWVDPTNPATYDIDTEFLMGDDVLVAPILEQGSTSRDIYIPRGTWRDVRTSSRIIGDRYIRDYKCELSCVPYFERM